MAGRRRRRGQRVHKVLFDGPSEEKMRLSVESVQEQNLKTTANIMDPKEREKNHQQQLLGMIQNLRKELSISKESNESLRVQLKKSDEELALKENEINFLRHTIFEVENECDSAIFAVKELQVKQEKTEAKADVKNGEQITVLHQSPHAQTEDREEKMASSDFNVMKEELENEISQLKELLKIKETQLNRASKRAKAHRTTLYKLDDTQRALGESILKYCGLEDDLSRQLAERDKHHLHEISKKEANFNKELSEQQAKFKQEHLEKEMSLKQQLSEMEESFQEDLSEKKERFLEGLSEKEENFQKKLSEKEQSFKKELSEKAAIFKKELLETEQTLKQQLSEKEESLQKELSEKEESFQKKVSAMMEMSDISARWEKRAHQLEEEKRKLEDYFQMKENIQHAVEVEKNEALQRLKEDHTQLQKALRKRKLKCCALQELSKQLAQRDERHIQELSEREETFRKELLQQEARFRTELSEKEEIFQKEFSEKDESFQKELCAKRELSEICASWERRVELLQEEKRELENVSQTKGNSKHSVAIKSNEELQCLKEENIQLQEALDKCKLKCCALENLGKHLAERDERYLQKLSEREDSFRRELSEQEARFKMKLAEKEENFEKQLTAIKELSEICASCERLNCCALEELSKKLANKDERHLQELSQREKTFREELSEQEARFKRELFQKEERLQKELSEQEESFKKKLSETEDIFLTKLSQTEEVYQKKLSEKEELFQKNLSAKDKCFQKKLSEMEESFQKELSETEEVLQNKLSQTEEIFQNKLSEKEEIFQNKLSEKEEIFQNKLSEKDEMFQNKLSEKDEMFQNNLSETEEIFQIEVSDMRKLSEMYASWERGDQQLEEEKRKLEDYLQTKENVQHSLEVNENEDLQQLKEEQTQLKVNAAREVDKPQDTLSFGHDARSQNASTLQTEDKARCSICQSVLTDPVSTPCGHTFCKNCITRLKRRKKKKNQCPICKETVATRKGFKSRITKLFNL